MCIIIDANKFNNVSSNAEPNNFEPIRVWLHRREGKIVCGGYLLKELSTNAAALRWYREMDRAGLVTKVNNQKVYEETEYVKTNVNYVSDDPHVIALARISGARLIYTADKDLIKDFKSVNVVPKPKGKVYKRAQNSNLLTKKICEDCG
jgi:predicted nucleic acid-binding protein